VTTTATSKSGSNSDGRSSARATVNRRTTFRRR
jgi:hypothetical protein